MLTIISSLFLAIVFIFTILAITSIIKLHFDNYKYCKEELSAKCTLEDYKYCDQAKIDLKWLLEIIFIF